MYIDYYTWETFEYTLKTLKLDLNNPRIKYRGETLNQTQIMQFLIANEKVYELAKKISEEGYFVGEEPIICIEDNKKVVLEGNRRTAALKLLQEPQKYLSTAKANTLLKNISKNEFPVNRKLKCYIAPNRLQANPIIYERHSGASLQKWETGNQYAFVADMFHKDGLSIEDICKVLNETRAKVIKPLKAYNLFYEGKAVLKKEGIDITVSTFDFTNLERFYSHAGARDFLGIDFDNDNGELIIKLPREEFEKRLLHVFKALIDAERFSRDFNKEDDKEKYVGELKSNPNFNLGITTDTTDTKSKAAEEKTTLEERKNAITTRRKGRGKKKNIDTVIVPRDKELVFDNEKLDTLFFELKHLPVDKEYAFAILLRTYLEQTLHFFLTQMELLDNLNNSQNEENQKNGLAKVNRVISHIKGKYSVSDEIDTEPIMNILRFNTPKEYAISLKPMLDYVKSNQLDDHLDQSQLKNLKAYIDNIKNDLDLAVHNINFTIDIGHNKRAWNTLALLFDTLITILNTKG